MRSCWSEKCNVYVYNVNVHNKTEFCMRRMQSKYSCGMRGTAVGVVLFNSILNQCFTPLSRMGWKGHGFITFFPITRGNIVSV